MENGPSPHEIGAPLRIELNMLNDPLSVHRYYSHLPTFYTKEGSPIVGNLYERDYDGRTVTAGRCSCCSAAGGSGGNAV